MARFLLAILVSASALSAHAGTVVVTSAFWGGKNVTTLAKKFCDTKEICEYKVSSQYIGASPTAVQSFKLTFVCSGSAAKHAPISFPSRAEGKVFTLDCSKASPAAASPAAKAVAKPVLDKAAHISLVAAPAGHGVLSDGPSPRLVVNPPSVESGKWNPRYPLKWKTSVHSLIYDDDRSGPVWTAIATPCLEAIRAHLKKGLNFYSQSIVRESYPLKTSTEEEESDLKFHHHTNADELENIASRRSYADLFKFVRGDLKTKRAFFYVAADASSSDEYGKYDFEVRFAPTARVFATKASGSSDTIIDELIERDPSLDSCRKEVLDSDAPILTVLAAEASHVDLLA